MTRFSEKKEVECGIALVAVIADWPSLKTSIRLAPLILSEAQGISPRRNQSEIIKAGTASSTGEFDATLDIPLYTYPASFIL